MPTACEEVRWISPGEPEEEVDVVAAIARFSACGVDGQRISMGEVDVMLTTAHHRREWDLSMEGRLMRAVLECIATAADCESARACLLATPEEARRSGLDLF